ncbi:MAG: hypothetical protein MI919_23360, partial [Holophagales bacterium]|nr:hypothetical protein [Holophagales bacterium]
MERRNLERVPDWIWTGFPIALLLLALWVMACGESEGPTDPSDVGEEVVVASCGNNGVPLDLDCAALPDTSAVGQWVDGGGNPLDPQPSDGQSDGNAYLDYDLWAWNSFVALNWPAVIPSSANGYQRGFPDLSASFAGASHDRLTVWETFKEKREVFLYDYVTKTPSSEVPQPWNAEPRYGPSNAQVPDCPETGSDHVAFQRHLATASETRKIYYDTLDETAEVASEALETRAVLCAGWVDPATQCGQIGENTCCTLNGQAVGPRVWKGDPHTDPGADPVLYEVKVNYDFFKYVVDDNTYYLVGNARTAASNGEIMLPARTSSSTMPPAPGQKEGGTKGPNPGPTGYSAGACLGVTTGTPCLAGSVHLKAAWIDVSDLDPSEQAKYHTAQGLHYITNDSVPGDICKEATTYGLVGLHIIQRIHQDIDESAGTQAPRGGTFVFATWEHTG